MAVRDHGSDRRHPGLAPAGSVRRLRRARSAAAHRRGPGTRHTLACSVLYPATTPTREISHECVLAPPSQPPRVPLNVPHTDELSYTENPFASTNSLDTNPFDDPTPKTAASSTSKVDSARVADLERRERDLERRETELTQRAEYIRKHGRNNWPPCTSCQDRKSVV